MTYLLRQRQLLLPFCLLLFLQSYPTRAYITSYHAVPAQRQIQWLKSLTVELTESTPVGKLSQRDVSAAGELMYAWSHTQHQGGIEHAMACEALIKRIIDEQRAAAASTNINQDSLQLTVEEYNYVLEGWLRSGAGVAAAERCEAILTNMQQQGGLVTPNLSSFKTVLMAWKQCSEEETTSRTGDDNDKDSIDFSSAAARAQRFLEYMIQLYINHENELALPDSDCFDIVLQSWSRSGHAEAPQNAERLLVAMERLYKSINSIKLKPRTTSFNAVLNAWAKSSHPQAAQRATDVLAFMELLSSTGDESVQPGTGSYNIVMGCLARHEDQAVAAKKADAVLKLAEKQASQQRQQQEQQKGAKSSSSSAAAANSPLVLDTILFNTAMGCWSKSNIPGAFRRARSILDRQVNLYKGGCHSCRPDVFAYTSVLGSCASESSPNPKQRLEAFQVAMATYRELQELDTPNHVSYGIMLKACSRLLPSSSPSQRRRQDELATEIFQDAINAGCVGDLVLSKLRDAVSTPQVYHELLQGHPRNKLPRSWTANVRERNDGRSKKHNHNNNNNKNRRRAEV